MAPTPTRRGLSPSAVLFWCLFAAQASLLVLSPILPQVAAEFQVSTSAAAQLRSVSGITAGVVALFVAARGGRYSLSRLLVLGLALLAASTAASAAAPTFALLLAAQVPLGIGLALVLSGALAASEAWATDGQGTKVLSWALVGQPVAWIVGQPLVGWVAGVDWRWAWIAVPFAASVGALWATVVRRETPEGALECDPGGLWRRRGVRPWAVGELAAFSAWAGTLVFAGAFFIEVYGASVEATGLVLGIIAAAYLPGNFLGRRWLATSGPAVLLVATAGALAAGVTVFGGVRPGLVFSTAVLAGLALLAGGRTISGAALGLQLAAGRRLAAMSVRTAVLQFGYLFGTTLGGVVLPVWGFTGVGVAYAALFAVAGAVHAGRAFGGRVTAEPEPADVLRRG